MLLQPGFMTISQFVTTMCVMANSNRSIRSLGMEQIYDNNDHSCRLYKDQSYALLGHRAPLLQLAAHRQDTTRTLRNLSILAMLQHLQPSLDLEHLDPLPQLPRLLHMLLTVAVDMHEDFQGGDGDGVHIELQSLHEQTHSCLRYVVLQLDPGCCCILHSRQQYPEHHFPGPIGLETQQVGTKYPVVLSLHLFKQRTGESFSLQFFEYVCDIVENVQESVNPIEILTGNLSQPIHGLTRRQAGLHYLDEGVLVVDIFDERAGQTQRGQGATFHVVVLRVTLQQQLDDDIGMFIEVLSHKLSRTDLDIILHQTDSDEIDRIVNQFFQPGEEIPQCVVYFDDLVESIPVVVFVLVEEQRLDAVEAGVDHVFVLLRLLHHPHILMAQFVQLFDKQLAQLHILPAQEDGLELQVDYVVEDQQALQPVHVFDQTIQEMQQCLGGQGEDGWFVDLAQTFLFVVVDQPIQLCDILFVQHLGDLLVEFFALLFWGVVCDQLCAYVLEVGVDVSPPEVVFKLADFFPGPVHLY